MKLNFYLNVEREEYGWKFNSSLLKDDIFTQECANFIQNAIAIFDPNSNPHIKWEF